MDKINKNMFLYSGVVFSIISFLTLIIDKNKIACIAGMTISFLCILFNFIFKVKWNNLARESLIKSCEEIKPFGKFLPLSIIGKLQIVWLLILLVTLFDSVAIKLFPMIPEILFIILENLSFSFFLFSIFYQLFQGNVKDFSKITAIFSFINIIDVIVSYFLNGHILSTRSMCLFLVFWALHKIFSIVLLEDEPIEIIKEKKVKGKKEIKKNKKEDKVEIVKEQKEEKNN